jgi:Fe-S oxidoreductase
MCPIFRYTPAEEASPRAKANLMRAVMTGRLPPTAVSQDDFKAVADLCVNCKMCKLECPAGVDIPKLMLEAKAGYVAVNGLRLGDWLLSRLDQLSAWGSWLSPLANRAIANRQARWLIEKLLGIAHQRKLPRFAGRSFLRRAARRRLTRATVRPSPKVLYFVDTYANYHDPQLGEALVALLEHFGVSVYVHPGQWASGLSLISSGVLDRAREIARHNVTLLAEGVRQGYEIVTAEPSSALALKQEYPVIYDDPDAHLVAEHTHEACDYLLELKRASASPHHLQPIPARLAYHEPCHLRALGAGTPGLELLRQIPQLEIVAEEHGCSGMAGTFGLQRQHFRTSVRAGWELIAAVRRSPVIGGATECSACKMQMEQGTDKPTIHPLKLLAASYGLLPGSASELLSAKSQPLVVT